MTIIYLREIMRSMVQLNPNKIFVFGDNDARSGYGGQAKEMRGETNTVGIRVKKRPSMDFDSFYTDDEYEINIRKIDSDLDRLRRVSIGKDIVFPTMGIGTGRARMQDFAPQTFDYLNAGLFSMFGIRNAGLSSSTIFVPPESKHLDIRKFGITNLKRIEKRSEDKDIDIVERRKKRRRIMKRCKCGK